MGGFGFKGKTPPKKFFTPETPPFMRLSEKTFTQQALYYRLNGDRNPLHADPMIAKFAMFS